LLDYSRLIWWLILSALRVVQRRWCKINKKMKELQSLATNSSKVCHTMLFSITVVLLEADRGVAFWKSILLCRC
jgi:hypothetical protein